MKPGSQSTSSRRTEPVRVSPGLFLAAARRLVSQSNVDVESAARRLVEGAGRHEIDLGMAYATLAPGCPADAPIARQACLAVRGSGRTAMLFLSEPADSLGSERDQAEEARACVEAACGMLRAEHAHEVTLAQALPEPEEAWAVGVLHSAGFIDVGTLRYMRRERAGRVAAPSEAGPWPDGVTVLRVDQLSEARGDTDSRLLRAMDRTYVETRDCPELCGLRETADILDSHRHTGQYDPSLWWLVLHNNSPAGCVLLNRCPEHRTVELVYLGLGPELRGKGLSKPLLSMGIARARQGNPSWSVTCAVDERNAAAIRLYESLGFEPYGRRRALVRDLAR
ncbi:MAG: GNAT family N-acetyltransferase [Phycisphaerales bacterium]|nr:GNAT family N-acetyltransferase [Phycisphaerales bacterium]